MTRQTQCVDKALIPKPRHGTLMDLCVDDARSGDDDVIRSTPLTTAMADVVITLHSGDKLGRRIRILEDSGTNFFCLFDRALAESIAVEQICAGGTVASVDILQSKLSATHEDSNAVIQNKLNRRWTNVCGTVEFMEGGIREEIAACTYRCKPTSFGAKHQIVTVRGNFLLSEGGTTALFRGFNSTKTIDEVMQHVFKQHSCRRVSLHMLVCSINVRHLVFVNSKLLDKTLMAEHDAAQPRWRATVVDSMDNVHGMKSLRIDTFDPAWLIRMDAQCVASIRMQISSHGSINLFITPVSDTVLAVGMEAHLDRICSFFAEMCALFT